MHSTNTELLLMTIGSIAGCCSGKKSSERLYSIERVFLMKEGQIIGKKNEKSEKSKLIDNR